MTVYRWIWPIEVDFGQRVVDEMDEALQPGTVEAHKLAHKPITSSLAVAACVEFKEEFGEVSDTKANRLLAHNYVRDWMRKTHPDLRKVDMLLHVPMAVELCLIPTAAAVRAASLQKEGAVKRRKQMLSHPR